MINYNKEFDKANISKFNIGDLFSEEKSLELKFNCVICGNKTSLAYSTSKEGHRLICNNCYYDHFKNTDEAIAFVEGKDE